MGKNTRIGMSLSIRFGLNSSWKGKDRDEVMRHNRSLWNELKGKIFQENKEEIRRRLKKDGLSNLFDPKKFPVHYIPGFVDSLDELHNVHGYGITDIGSFFGLNRERIRQYFEMFDIERREERGTTYRVWDDDEERFITTSSMDLEETLIRSRTRRKDIEAGKRISSVVWDHINAIQDFQREHGREPTLIELGTSLGSENPIQNIAPHWGYSVDNDVSYREAIDNLYRVAGAEERRDQGGGRGVKKVMRSLV